MQGKDTDGKVKNHESKNDYEIEDISNGAVALNDIVKRKILEIAKKIQDTNNNC